MEKEKIIKKSLIYLVGNLSSRLLSSLLIPLYAFKVNSKDLGTFDNAQSWMNIIVPIIFVAIWESILKFVLSEYNENTLRKMISSTLIYVLAASVLLVLLMSIYCMIFHDMANMLFITVMMLAGGLAQIWQYFARALKRNKVYAVSGVISTAINIGTIVPLLYFCNLGSKSLFLAFITSQVAVILIIELRVNVLRYLSFKDFDWNILVKMLLFSAPLVLNLISGWLISGFGRVIITNYLGADANGLYSFANKFAILVTTLGTVISMTVIEEAILSAGSADFAWKFSQVINKTFHIFESLIILVFPAISLFYFIIGKTEYRFSLIYVPLLLLSAGIMSMATNIGAAFQALNKTKYVFITTSLGAIVTAIFSLAFLKVLGVSSIVLGQVFGSLVMLLSRYFIVSKMITLKISWKPIIINFLLYGVISFACINTGVVVGCLMFTASFLYVILTNRSYLPLVMKILFKNDPRRLQM